MRALLYKEFKLSIHPATFLFMLFGILLLVPSWPFFIAFGYLFIGIFNTFFIGRANGDVFFTACLPVRKNDVVLARITTIAAIELAQLIIAIPFAFINLKINPYGNNAGMNPNFAFFGCVLIMYAIFNTFLFPAFYKTAYKIGGPAVLSIILSLIFTGVVETVVHIVPSIKSTINDIGSGHFQNQLVVLIAGIILFFALTWLGYKRAAKNFEKVDL